MLIILLTEKNKLVKYIKDKYIHSGKSEYILDLYDIIESVTAYIENTDKTIMLSILNIRKTIYKIGSSDK